MSYETELAFAKDLAREAGKIMRRYFRAEDIGHSWKEDNTPLTIADTTINDMVIDRVQEAFPSHGVIGEENSYETDRKLVWVVDPVDGTVPFSLGIPISTFSLGLVDKRDGQAVIGVIYDPQLDHLYTAARGEGAYLNGKKLKTSTTTELKRSYVSVITGLKEGSDHHSSYMPGACFDILRSQGAHCSSIPTQVYFASRVATGEYVGSIFGFGSPWDSAAASILVEEAGGIVTDVNGNKRRFDKFEDGCVLAANKSIQTLLLRAINQSTP